MRHDPERSAAAYLAGELSARQRARFEAHLLGCDDCWREVGAGRRGRELAEAVRELAPQHLRDRVRATVEATPARPRRPRRLAAAVAAGALAAALGAGGLVAVGERSQPAPIQAVVARYRAGGAWSPDPSRPPAPRLGDLVWRGTGRGVVGGVAVVAHTYQDAAGHRVVLLVSDRVFPEAAGARPRPAGGAWMAEVDGVVLYCAEHPAPSLVVGQDRAEVLLAADRLRLDGAGR
jgi:Putative zinc-finger